MRSYRVLIGYSVYDFYVKSLKKIVFSEVATKNTSIYWKLKKEKTTGRIGLDVNI